MARTVDLSRLTPDEVTCFACDREVKLSRHARRARKFRCPFCHADNRILADGSTRPLSGEAETIDQMAVVACRRCRTNNRLPSALVRRRSFCCHSCHTVQAVPRAILQEYGVNSPAATALTILATLVVVGVALSHVGDAAKRHGLPWRDYGPTVRYRVQRNLVLESARPLPPTAAGARYEAVVRVFNPWDRPVDFHVRAQVTYRGRSVVGRTVTVRAIGSGEWRSVTICVVDPSHQAVDALGVEVAGIS